MTKQPTPDALRFAAEWLRCYDGQDDGQDTLAETVAAWLEEQAASRELREVARTYGIPVARLRAKLVQNPEILTTTPTTNPEGA